MTQRIQGIGRRKRDQHRRQITGEKGKANESKGAGNGDEESNEENKGPAQSEKNRSK